MNKKTAVVYDKWLHSLGGGEVVACSIAKILKDLGYDVLFISGKYVAKETILEKLKINLDGIKFKQIWNDESGIKKLTVGKDLFVNISFMDYTFGFAKKNIYYVNFPTKLYDSFRGKIVNGFVLPFISKFMKPIEALHQIDAPVVIHGTPAYALSKINKFALTNLKKGSAQKASFKIYLESFYKSFLEGIEVSLQNGKITDKRIEIKHNFNSLKFTLDFIPEAATVYLNLNIKNFDKYEKIENSKIYLYYPKIYLSKVQTFFLLDFFERFRVRLRAGIFTNVGKRLATYQKVITYSRFAWRWIKKYWNIEAAIIAPPVDLLNKKYKIQMNKKENWICSVGRFFTLGHGKKQEVMIEAFKKMYDKSKDTGWELHLVGGLGDEPSSIEFFQYLKEQAKDYPIFFHINVSGKEVEEIYLKSRIYWHATGFGEDENYQPIRFEHFGISPIEALSAGCVPILFNGGALGELLEGAGLDSKKHLFSTINELVNQSIYFQDSKNRDFDWKEIFKNIDKNYSAEAFSEKFIKLLSSLK